MRGCRTAKVRGKYRELCPVEGSQAVQAGESHRRGSKVQGRLGCLEKEASRGRGSSGFRFYLYAPKLGRQTLTLSLAEVWTTFYWRQAASRKRSAWSRADKALERECRQKPRHAHRAHHCVICATQKRAWHTTSAQ